MTVPRSGWRRGGMAAAAVCAVACMAATLSCTGGPWQLQQLLASATGPWRTAGGASERAPSCGTLASATAAPSGTDAAEHAHEHHGTSANPLAAPVEEAACRMSGKVVDCGCDFASVERMNQQHLQPLLSELVRKPFFRFFKVNLYCDCQFWPDAGMCVQRDCCVSECDANDIPLSWREHDKALAAARARRNASCSGDAGVDRNVDEGVRGALTSVTRGWRVLNNPWLPEDEEDVQEYAYVDLQLNVEKYTGYKGEDARRIWAAIYDQSALKEAAALAAQQQQEAAAGGGGGGDAAGVAREQQVLYRLVSGMHASITTSIVSNFYDEDKGTWGANLPFFKARFASPSSKPHLENLYFTLLFVLRAVTKAGKALSSLDFGSGWSEEDAHSTQQLVSKLVNLPELQAACPTPFDEGLLWTGHDPQRRAELRRKLQTAFHNITRLMDCVGCEKCKMHGKLNVLGIATALKVLFSSGTEGELLDEYDEGVAVDLAGPLGTGASAAGGEAAVAVASGSPDGELVLDRNEAIALVNFMAKLSDSVETVRALSIELAEQERQQRLELEQAGAVAAAAA